MISWCRCLQLYGAVGRFLNGLGLSIGEWRRISIWKDIGCGTWNSNFKKAWVWGHVGWGRVGKSNLLGAHLIGWRSIRAFFFTENKTEISGRGYISLNGKWDWFIFSVVLYRQDDCFRREQFPVQKLMNTVMFEGVFPMLLGGLR